MKTSTPKNDKLLKCGRVIKFEKGRDQTPHSQDWKNLLDSHLTKMGLKQSESRNKIAEVILKQDDHFSVQELIRKVQALHPSIGEATVYRNMSLFVEVGIIKESLSGSQGQSVFEVSTPGHHDHIVCLDCDAIIEFHEAKIESLQEKTAKSLAFAQSFHKHVIYAHCNYFKGKK